MRQFKRSDRLAEQILRTISTVMETELLEWGQGMVTFTRVKMTDKLRSAEVYFSFMGTEESRETLAGYLFAQRGRIRSRVGRHLHIRHIPELTFKFDPSIEESIRLESLFNKIKDERDSDQ